MKRFMGLLVAWNGRGCFDRQGGWSTSPDVALPWWAHRWGGRGTAPGYCGHGTALRESGVTIILPHTTSESREEMADASALIRQGEIILIGQQTQASQLPLRPAITATKQLSIHHWFKQPLVNAFPASRLIPAWPGRWGPTSGFITFECADRTTRIGLGRALRANLAPGGHSISTGSCISSQSSLWGYLCWNWFNGEVGSTYRTPSVTGDSHDFLTGIWADLLVRTRAVAPHHAAKYRVGRFISTSLYFVVFVDSIGFAHGGNRRRKAHGAFIHSRLDHGCWLNGNAISNASFRYHLCPSSLTIYEVLSAPVSPAKSSSGLCRRGGAATKSVILGACWLLADRQAVRPLRIQHPVWIARLLVSTAITLGLFGFYHRYLGLMASRKCSSFSADDCTPLAFSGRSFFTPLPLLPPFWQTVDSLFFKPGGCTWSAGFAEFYGVARCIIGVSVGMTAGLFCWSAWLDLVGVQDRIQAQAWGISAGAQRYDI